MTIPELLAELDRVRHSIAVAETMLFDLRRRQHNLASELVRRTHIKGNNSHA